MRGDESGGLAAVDLTTPANTRRGPGLQTSLILQLSSSHCVRLPSSRLWRNFELDEMAGEVTTSHSVVEDAILQMMRQDAFMR